MRNRGIGQVPVPVTQAQVAAMIVQSANQYGVPVNVALGIASHESGFNPNATNNNTNGTTDYGVMQLNTSVLQTFGLTPAQAFDPQTNIDTSMKLMSMYLSKYNGDVNTALWAYASGAGTVAAGGPPNSTATGFINYVTNYDDSNILAQIGNTPASPGVPTASVDPNTGLVTDTSVVNDGTGGTGTNDSTLFSVDPTTALVAGALILTALYLS